MTGTDSSGRYIAPTKIENRLRQAPEIQYAVVFGDDRPFAVALIFTDRQFLAAGDATAVRTQITQIVAKTNRRLSKPERIRQFTVIDEALTTESGLLTPTFKPRRSRIYEHFADEIESMYADQTIFSRGADGDSVAQDERKEYDSRGEKFNGVSTK